MCEGIYERKGRLASRMATLIAQAAPRVESIDKDQGETDMSSRRTIELVNNFERLASEGRQQSEQLAKAAANYKPSNVDTPPGTPTAPPQPPTHTTPRSMLREPRAPARKPAQPRRPRATSTNGASPQKMTTTNSPAASANVQLKRVQNEVAVLRKTLLDVVGRLDEVAGRLEKL